MGWITRDQLCPFPSNINARLQGYHMVLLQLHTLSNCGLEWHAGWEWGKAEPPRQTFPILHFTSVVLLVALLLGKAYGGITGIPWLQMSTAWEQNHGKRWRALSLSPNNAWEDDNRVEWDLRERAENGRSKQSSSSSYKRLFIKHKKGRAKSSKPTEITYANSLTIRGNIRTWHPQLYRKNVWLPLSRSVCIR